MYVADLIGEDGNDEHHSQPDEEGQGHRLCRVALVLLSLLHTYIHASYIHTLKVLKSKMMSSYTHTYTYTCISKPNKSIAGSKYCTYIYIHTYIHTYILTVSNKIQ